MNAKVAMPIAALVSLLGCSTLHAAEGATPAAPPRNSGPMPSFAAI